MLFLFSFPAFVLLLPSSSSLTLEVRGAEWEANSHPHRVLHVVLYLSSANALALSRRGIPDLLFSMFGPSPPLLSPLLVLLPLSRPPRCYRRVRVSIMRGPSVSGAGYGRSMVQ